MERIINCIFNWTINRIKEGLFYADKYQSRLYVIIFLIGLMGCINERKNTCELKIVEDKTKEGRSRYLIAFKDLTSAYVGFGIYANVNKNDTLYYINNCCYSTKPCK
jgi:hypothetical protein